MAKVEDYVSGKILEDAKTMLKAIKSVELPLIGGYIGKKLVEKIKKKGAEVFEDTQKLSYCAMVKN